MEYGIEYQGHASIDLRVKESNPQIHTTSIGLSSSLNPQHTRLYHYIVWRKGQRNILLPANVKQAEENWEDFVQKELQAPFLTY